eukprot:5486176-Prymnesium_polylepis.1
MVETKNSSDLSLGRRPIAKLRVLFPPSFLLPGYRGMSNEASLLTFISPFSGFPPPLACMCPRTVPSVC